ncbi:MAG: hypothetical protein VX438_04290 [Planctomycetota bacterium]|nr:hypothetical protein [Planctomycetota bacterium]
MSPPKPYRFGVVQVYTHETVAGVGWGGLMVNDVRFSKESYPLINFFEEWLDVVLLG